MATTEDLLPEIDSIDAGGNFTLALGEDGVLWAWGDNTRGQLGLGHLDKTLAPQGAILQCGEKTPE
jgi:alpha-tubulin suppressor-like RCC1 family protein